MRRRQRDHALNLFAFQDIITGVAGVMLFVLLLLVVHLTLRTASTAVEFEELVESAGALELAESPTDSETRERLEAMRKKLEQLRQRSAAWLQATDGNLDQKIDNAEAELESLMHGYRVQQSQAEAIVSEMASEETSQEKASILATRNALRQQLRELHQEQQLHAAGKLVAFHAESSGLDQLWIIDMRATRAEIFDVQFPRDAFVVDYDRFDPPAKIVRAVTNGLQEQTSNRSVVIILRPSIAGTGSEVLDAFRHSGIRIALEILDEDTRIAPPATGETQ